ncbi:MAG: tail fiber protein [Rhodobacter sp.]|nr:tail fiber protein [Rhodobacter sp.]
MKNLVTTLCLGLGLAAVSAPAPVHAQSTPQIGQIVWMGFNFCPRGWMQANGALLAVSSNTALFSLYGTTFGGDGRTTFALPDLSGRVPVGQGAGPGLTPITMGQKAGVENNTMTETTLPNHSHTGELKASSAGPGASTLNGNMLATGAFYSGGLASADATLKAGALTTANTGGNVPFNNMQPSLAQLPCVAVQGTYPSRS